MLNGNIKMDLREIGWGGMDWCYLAQDGDRWMAHVNTVMNLRVAKKKVGNFQVTERLEASQGPSSRREFL